MALGIAIGNTQTTRPFPPNKVSKHARSPSEKKVQQTTPANVASSSCKAGEMVGHGLPHAQFNAVEEPWEERTELAQAIAAHF